MFFIVDICISLCLRAPGKIDSSIGLPSLNKVVTYLLIWTCLHTDTKSCSVIVLCFVVRYFVSILALQSS